jgi:alkylation response protein AidB-like acyl-CoA dehydrogenase
MIFDTALDDIEMTATALAGEFAETAGEYDRTAAFPFANIERLRETRLAALVVSREYGGRGAGLVRANRVVNAIAQGEASTGLVLAQQYLFHAALRANPGFSSALKDRIFRSAAEDGAFVNSLRVEPELGTPIRGGLPATIARRTSTGWALSGRKIYATGSPVLAWNAIWARTDEAEPRVGPFIVPAGAPGFTIEETWRQLGMRASGSHDVMLDNVEIPFDHAADLKTLDELTGPDATQMAWVAVLFSAIYDGAARAARDWFVKFLRERAPTNLGAPLATLPRMQQAVGEIDSALCASRILLASIAERVDRGETPHLQESLYVKHNVTKNALDAVSKAMEFSGIAGAAKKSLASTGASTHDCTRSSPAPPRNLLHRRGHPHMTLILRHLPALGPAVVFACFNDAQRAAVADADAAIDALPQPDPKRPDVDLAGAVGDKQEGGAQLGV